MKVQDIKTTMDAYNSLEVKVMDFLYWLCEVPYNNDLELDYLKWDIDSGSEVVRLFINDINDYVRAELEYIDPYESSMDSTDTVTFPVEWLERFYNYCPTLEAEIIAEYIKYDKEKHASQEYTFLKEAERRGYKVEKL